MAAYPGVTGNSSLVTLATSQTVPTETLTDVVFGILAVLGTFITAWQGHKAWKIWQRGNPRPPRDLNTTTSDVELQSHHDGEPQRAHPTVTPPLPDAFRRSSAPAVMPTSLSERTGSPGASSTSLPPPQAVEAHDYPLQDPTRAITPQG